MVRASRPGWASLPRDLRAAVEHRLGSAVVAAASMPGGWSPGTADRLLLADGRRTFVKAASAEVNAEAVRLHRREAAVLAALTGSGAAPDLLGLVETGPWFALLTEDLAGRHPAADDADDTRAVLDALLALPDPAPALPQPVLALESAVAELNDGWRRLLEDDAEDAVPGGRSAAVALAALAAAAPSAVRGDGLAHLDLRIDNALITPAGARLIDWPFAAVGAPWFDALTYALDAHRLRADGEPFALPRHPLLDDVPADAVDAVIAACTGYFLDSARRPEPNGLPGIRAFQREQGLVLLEVLQERGAVLSPPG